MPSTETKALISRVFLEKGKLRSFSMASSFSLANLDHRFGWVNASYVYGLDILNAHMRRALGAITPYDTYSKAVSMQYPY